MLVTLREFGLVVVVLEPRCVAKKLKSVVIGSNNLG